MLEGGLGIIDYNFFFKRTVINRYNFLRSPWSCFLHLDQLKKKSDNNFDVRQWRVTASSREGQRFPY
jgi:hypothetical protein